MIQVTIKFDQLGCRFLDRVETDAVKRMMTKPVKPVSWRTMKSENKPLCSLSTVESAPCTAEESFSEPEVQADEQGNDKNENRVSRSRGEV